jgi:hydrogenase maturation protease
MTVVPDIPLVVLGIGNSILSDDGVGVHAVTLLRDDPRLPAGTELVDGGTNGLALLPTIARAEALILVDAVDVGAPAGSVHVLRGADLYADLLHLSVHQVGAADLLAAATLTGALPRHVVLVGVQPASLAPGTRLSAAVAAALPEAIGTVRQWCHRLTGSPVAG